MTTINPREEAGRIIKGLSARLSRSQSLTGAQTVWLMDAITAALSRREGAIPDGWVLVPVEPTEEMLSAATATTWGALRKLIRSQWKAMLAAAPSPPVPQETESGWRPIETARSDTQVWLCWSDKVWLGYASSSTWWGKSPTFWMPCDLPSPPSAKPENREIIKGEVGKEFGAKPEAGPEEKR